MKLSVVLLFSLVALQAALLGVPSAEASGLKVGYYNKKCRGVEDVVKGHIIRAIKKNPRVGAALVRLVFHDCFVRGCDGSVLLDKSAQNPKPEKEAKANIGLAAFDILEMIKADIEKKCPGVVSCSDILVYAARDATKILSKGHINYDVPAGRLDGFVSLASQADKELPDSTFTAQQLIKSFALKNFDVEEMVILSGAHSIGMAHCSSFKGRLAAPADQINPAYRKLLNYKCGQSANPPVVNNVRDEEYTTVAKYMPGFKSRVRKIRDLFDNSYYHNNLARIVSFNSDWQLLTHTEARGHVHEYADNGTLWNEDFAASMVKLSMLPMPAGSKGGIRKKCSIVSY
ncbi:peroxidase 2-like [Lolium rigidum]|uniref:peroxidase 2-like n=1 Tax=Lolium rigidum TaxID=89674 RepID=UPI001F5C7238|nr:peroxidase 2-like [Lolium rigidum]